ncbi:NAD(P)H-dependent oxidoreductase [Prevotella sp. 10(H)]|uniref:NAD(P)H-dependent oxidoreductase n=1 Tax=Prevotella sp. 10(H) TaxID=1158294 RepID=UPI0004A6E447|nr:NAD(P)H-dependent oxidoreductase [Prevotella sp. 10(H)]
MKVSVILAHPYNKSLNNAIAATVAQRLKENNHTVYFHDLYAEGFNPLITPDELISDNSRDELVIKHTREIREAEGLVIVHPNWWGQPPAILKGWVDRVLRQGIAYDFPEGDNGGGLPVGLLNVQAGIVFNTSNTPQEREDSVFGDPLENIWKECIFGFCGIHTYERRMYRVVADSTDEERKTWLEDAASLINKYFPKI